MELLLRLFSRLFVTVLSLAIFSPVLTFAQQREIPIGAEIGPEHLFGDCIHLDHAVFRDSSYFYPSMKRCGIDYIMSVYNTGFYQQRGGVAERMRMGEILRANSLKLLIVARDTTVNGHSIVGQHAFRGENLGYNSPFLPNNVETPLWDPDFFPENRALGNSVDAFDGDDDDPNTPHWRTDRNPGGFIIGEPDSAWPYNNDYDDNMIDPGTQYAAFCLGNHRPEYYYVRFLMKRVNDLPDTTDALLTLYSRNSSAEYDGGATYMRTKRCMDVPTSWGWVEFELMNPLFGNTGNATEGKKNRICIEMEWLRRG